MFTMRRSSSDSLESTLLLSVLITFIWEKARSSLPVDEGNEKRSSMRTSALDHSPALGAWKIRHQTARYQE